MALFKRSLLHENPGQVPNERACRARAVGKVSASLSQTQTSPTFHSRVFSVSPIAITTNSSPFNPADHSESDCTD